MEKKALYLSYDGMTDPLGQSQVLTYIIGLQKKGISFTLISFEKTERYKQEGAAIKQICRENNINWQPLFYTKYPKVVSTLFDLIKIYPVIKRLQKSKQFDIVHCRSYITSLIGLRLKRKYGIKFIFDMRGFWVDERVEGGIWNLKSPVFKFIYNYFKNKEKAFLSKSDAIVSLTHTGKNELLNWSLNNVTANKISVIPCCVDLAKFNPEAISKSAVFSLKQQLQLTNRLVVGYVGSIGTWYLLDEMLRFFKTIDPEKNPIFVLLTKDPAEQIYAKAEEAQIKRENILVLSVKHTDIPMYLLLFDCSVFFIRASFSKKASSPTKQAELMAMGIPVICNAGVGDSAAIIEDYQAGQVMASNNEHEVAIVPLDLRTFDKESAKNGARNYFDLATGVERYWDIYQNLLFEKS
jgi:glycosyltransferase involved in cell wall biosynthesis